MAKEDETPKASKKNPVKMMTEAIAATKDDENEDEIPTVSFNVDPESALKSIKNSIAENFLGKVQRNQFEEAAAISERTRIEEERRLAKAKEGDQPTPTVQPPRLGSQIGIGGGLLPQLGVTDRATIVEAALKGLQTDEARLKWLEAHDDLFNSSIPTSLMPGHSRGKDPVPVSANSVDPLTGVVDSFVKIFNLSESLHKQSPSPNSSTESGVSQSLSSQLDILKIVGTFKEISDNQTKMVEKIFDGITDQFKNIQAANAERENSMREKLLEANKEVFQVQQSHLSEKIQMMERQLSQPQQIPIGDLSKLIGLARQDGVPISMETPDQERIRSENARKDRELDHKLNLETKKQDIEMLKEKKRLVLVQAGAGALGVVPGMFEGGALKKHNNSPAGQAVADRI